MGTGTGVLRGGGDLLHGDLGGSGTLPKRCPKSDAQHGAQSEPIGSKRDTESEFKSTTNWTNGASDASFEAGSEKVQKIIAFGRAFYLLNHARTSTRAQISHLQSEPKKVRKCIPKEFLLEVFGHRKQGKTPSGAPSKTHWQIAFDIKPTKLQRHSKRFPFSEPWATFFVSFDVSVHLLPPLCGSRAPTSAKYNQQRLIVVDCGYQNLTKVFPRALWKHVERYSKTGGNI